MAKNQWGERKLVMSPSWVNALKPGARIVEYRDIEQRGLILRVETSGLRSWVCRFSFEGVEERLALGSYPETSLRIARQRAEKARGRAQGGENAAGSRRALRVGGTVREVAASWLASEDTKHWRTSSRTAFEQQLAKHVYPGIGGVKLVQLRRAHVQALLDGIVGKPHTRNRTLEVVRMLCRWAVGRELIQVSPCEGLRKLREPKRTRVFTDDEVRQIVAGFDTTQLGCYVRFLFHTAARRDEALSIRWADVDLKRGVWTIPADSEKTGATRGEARRLPLSRAALAVLAEQRKQNMARGIGVAEYVFAGASGDRRDRTAPKPIIYRLKGLRDNGTKANSKHKLAKHRPVLIPTDFRLHDIRRSVADRMLNHLGLDAYTVDVGVLGHARPSMLSVYTPSDATSKTRDAFECWAGEFERIVGGAPVEVAADAAARE